MQSLGDSTEVRSDVHYVRNNRPRTRRAASATHSPGVGHFPRDMFPGRSPLPIMLLDSGIIFSVSMVKECSKHQILLCYH